MESVVFARHLLKILGLLVNGCEDRVKGHFHTNLANHLHVPTS